MNRLLHPIYKNKIDFVLENLDKSPKVILDAGCGDGTHLRVLRKNKKFEVWGVDVEKLADLPNVLCCSIEKMPFKDKKFDAVVCVDVLEHVDSPKKAIKELNRVLKKGGQLILTVPNYDFPATYDPINAFLRLFGTHIPIGLWAWGHKRLFKKEQIEKLISSNGFKIKKYETRSFWFLALFVNYIPYLTVYVIKPVANLFGKGKDTVRTGRKSKIIKIYSKINDYDKKHMSSGNPINHCFLAKKK
ncbi:MAG: methyltransferase domain-containing protein [archaeon]